MCGSKVSPKMHLTSTLKDTTNVTYCHPQYNTSASEEGRSRIFWFGFPPKLVYCAQKYFCSVFIAAWCRMVTGSKHYVTIKFTILIFTTAKLPLAVVNNQLFIIIKENLKKCMSQENLGFVLQIKGNLRFDQESCWPD